MTMNVYLCTIIVDNIMITQCDPFTRFYINCDVLGLISSKLAHFDVLNLLQMKIVLVVMTQF